jgi:hypothetical protein
MTSNTKNESEKVIESEEVTESISKNESFKGFYADIDGDGDVDGIIYVDLAMGCNGSWDESYSVTAVSDISKLKDYYISQESYVGTYGEDPMPVIAPVTGSTGEDRFYVMALTDIDGKRNGTTYTWYETENLTNVITSEDFGTGKKNTIDVMKAWSSDTNASSNDFWGAIKAKVEAGWFVPSIVEWEAFAGEIENLSNGYDSIGLSDYYWSSSQCEDLWPSFDDNHYDSSLINFYYGGVSGFDIHDDFYVRLSTTF